MTKSLLNPLRSTWHAIRNAPRRLLGFYSYEVAWHYVAAKLVPREQRAGPRPERHLAALPTYEAEGIGGQFVKWNTARLLARRHGLTFVHHPFTRSSHSPGLDWERFLGFGVGEIEYSSLANRGDIRVVDIPPLRISATDALFGKANVPADFLSLTLEHVLAPRPVLFRLGPDTWMDAQANELEELKNKYRAARRVGAPIDRSPATAAVTVAVHIRRGDVRTLKESGSDEGKRRWIDEAYYANLCHGINNALGAEHVELRVYSDDVPESFEMLPSIPNVHFRLREGAPVEADVAFDEMISADMLVIGMSSFSYLAALLSDGVKLVPWPYAHEVPADWIKCDAAGSFEARQLLTSMEGRSSSKLPQGQASCPVQAATAEAAP